jgi:hypothetical protein
LPLAILGKVSHFDEQLLTVIGGRVIVVLSAFFYVMITWAILRFFQVLFKLDRRMRVITTAYFEERANPNP